MPPEGINICFHPVTEEMRELLDLMGGLESGLHRLVAAGDVLLDRAANLASGKPGQCALSRVLGFEMGTEIPVNTGYGFRVFT